LFLTCFFGVYKEARLNNRGFMRLFINSVLLISLSIGFHSARGIDVSSYRYGNNDRGANTNETILSLDNVDPWDFGLKFTVPVSGQIYGAPLVKTINNKSLVFVVTQQNVVAAIDATNGSVVWSNALAVYGNPVPNEDTGSWDIQPFIGICSTPIIDSANNLYLLSKAKTNDGVMDHYNYAIYKINASNGSVIKSFKFADTGFDGSSYYYRTNSGGDPYVIGYGDGSIWATIPLLRSGRTANVSTNVVYFNALRQMNRPGLSIVNGTLYAAFASHGDNGPYHGWLLGFNTNSLAVSAVLNTTPNGGLAGIWQSGGCVASDNSGNLYMETGNGSFDGSRTNTHGFPVDANYGDCFLKISPDSSSITTPNPNGWGLKVSDYFTPTNNQSINDADLDVGSCGPVVIPVGTRTYILGTGKDGSLYSMNSSNMGKFDPNTNHCLQTINQATGNGGEWTGFCTPSYLNNRIYLFGSGDYGKQFTFNNGLIGSWFIDGGGIVRTDVQTQSTYNWPGANTSISANGTKSQIVWAIDQSASILHAFRASDLLEIWNSTMSQADSLNNALKFTVPIVANGQVFVGTDGALFIYGLAPAQRSTPSSQ
jgi:hypothetical protein